MLISDFNLTYCTNIHPSETWEETFEELQKHLPKIKSEVSPNQKMGLGLRLSNISVLECGNDATLKKFTNWLLDSDLYVFTANAFPFGSFHHAKVKDNVHTPGWSTKERLQYSKNFATILTKLPCIAAEQSMSTSPLSYTHWHKTETEKNNIKNESAKNLLEMVFFLHDLETKTGRYIHLDIEPEPDGLIENNDEFITFYTQILLPLAIKNHADGEKLVRRYIALCYDICHYAIMYENHALAIQKLITNGIKIGKIQISSALKVTFTNQNKNAIVAQISKFVESTYLHQVVQLNKDNSYTHFTDLNIAIQSINENALEWRVHFHVPIFDVSFEAISSTQLDILEVLQLNKKLQFCQHLEIETYTWDILPGSQKKPLSQSIVQEIQWVKEKIK